MDRFIIEGGYPIDGTVRISGAKNAALPLLSGAILASTPLTLTNVPSLKDVHTLIELIAGMGVTITKTGDTVHVDNSTHNSCFAQIGRAHV